MDSHEAHMNHIQTTHSRQKSHEGHTPETSHETHANHGSHVDVMRNRFFVCLVLMIPILFLSPFMSMTLPFQFSFPGSGWVVFALSSVLYFYGGWPFLQGAVDELKSKSPAMMTLISLGISTAYFYSLYAFFSNTFLHTHHVMDFFWELATLIVIMLLGHWVEMKTVSSAGDALKKMAELLPSTASVQQSDGSFKEAPIRELSIGQTVRVKGSAKVPADGIVLEGQTTVNESMVTGEAKDIVKKKDDTVIGGSVNGNGSILIRVTGTGESGYLAQVMQLVDHAQKEKSKAEVLSDKVARLLFYAAVGVGLITLVVWYLVTGDPGLAVASMVTVLIIACPHALGLAIPLVVARSTSLGAKNGLLIRNRRSLEAVRKVSVIAMDKTGTLTEGNFKVTGVVALEPEYSSDEVLSLAAALEVGSSHPLAVSVVREAKSRDMNFEPVSNFQDHPGAGLSGQLADGRTLRLMNLDALRKLNLSFDESSYQEFAQLGYSLSYLIVGETVAGLIAQGDTVKSGSASLVAALKAENIRPVMLTGDNEYAAKIAAEQVGISDVRAGLLPQDKEEVIKELQQSGESVMMVGDGVNDAPSLARANVGVAIGTGTDVAIDSADVILVKSDPADILHVLSLARNSSRKMTQNLWWGAGYNIVAIPLAAGILAPIGIILSPAVGAVLMSLSTIAVALNALTLKVD